MNILFVAATGPELRVVKSEVKKLWIKRVSCEFFCSWVGNYETILTLTKFLSDQEARWKKYDFLVNIGVCGHWGNPEKIIQVGRIWNINTEKESLVPIIFDFAKVESIICSEEPILERDILDKGKSNYVDMESFAVEFIAQKWKMPRAILKVPVDEVGEETRRFDREMALGMLRENVKWDELVKNINWQ